jgi:hypothetical protein
LLVLLAFSSFAIDEGLMYVSRRQAQNSADMGAMAAAVALALDDYTDRSSSGPAVQAGMQFGQVNPVWGQAPIVTNADVTFPPCPDDGTDACVRVDAYRNQARGNALPSFFGQLVGVTSQGVRATATAKAAIGNSSDCLKPWAIADKWFENTAPAWDLTDTYDRRYKNGPNAGQLLPTPRDDYAPPTATSPGSGFTLPLDLGLQVTLKAGNPQASLAPGLFFPVDLPRADGQPITGGEKFRTNIETCNGTGLGIGDYVTFEPGNMIGPTQQGVNVLIAQDPTASWNAATNSIVGSCAPACSPTSPRLVAIPVFHTDLYDSGQATGRVDIQIVNILGFFLDHMQGNDVVGYFMTYPGQLDANAPTVGNQSAFTRTVVLVR